MCMSTPRLLSIWMEGRFEYWEGGGKTVNGVYNNYEGYDTPYEAFQIGIVNVIRTRMGMEINGIVFSTFLKIVCRNRSWYHLKMFCLLYRRRPNCLMLLYSEQLVWCPFRLGVLSLSSVIK